MTTSYEHTRLDSCKANVAILSALGLDPAEVLSATIQMDGEGCTLTVRTIKFEDDKLGGPIAEAVQHFIVLPHPPLEAAP